MFSIYRMINAPSHDLQSVGIFAGTLVSPHCADTFGRKKTLTIGNVFMVIGSALQATSQSVGMFMGAR